MSTAAHEHTNRLIHETSPYLLQHAHNPVDWYPWGAEALARAQQEHKPIFLSVGYSACHWCHVMEHESFEDPAVAAIMNEHFVCIKVDREERPDLDAVYMQAVQALTGQGGWPMSVFLTPEGQPFYGGTYFPPAPRYGMPSFVQLLQHIQKLWTTKPDELHTSAAELTAVLGRGELQGGRGEPTLATLDTAYQHLVPRFDRTHGGWGGAPKFPQPQTLEFVLRHHRRTGDRTALRMFEQTLDHMARGGMYDQLGGGFHRYSVDERWLVPHFEKMLYDNAQLARVYLHAWQVTGEARYRQVVEETLDYVVREMTAPDGGFYATQDADSEGVEGKFFVWDADEVRDALGSDALRWMQLYNVTAKGNWEGHTILNQPRPLAEVARVLGMREDELQALAARGRATLLAVREQRIHPGRDEKIVVAWNGLMLAAFAEAGRVLERRDYLAVAERNAAFVMGQLYRDGRLVHVYPSGQTTIPGFAEDYALYAAGLLALYRATFEPRHLAQARALADTLLAEFWDDEHGGVWQTSSAAEALIARPKALFDEAVPSANGIAAAVFRQLAVLFDQPDYEERASAILRLAAAELPQYPTAFGALLVALDELLATPQEVAVIGDLAAPDTAALLAVLNRAYLPHTTVAASAPTDTPSTPLLAERPQRDGRATAYVCQRYSCQQPTTDPAELAQQLGIG